MVQETDLKAKDKLLWLGFKRAAQSLSDVEKEMEKKRNTIGDFSTFEDHFQNGYDLDGDGTKETISNFSDYKTYLMDHGWTAEEADAYIEKIKNNYTDENNNGTVFDEYKDYVINDADSYTELKNTFNSSTEIGSEKETEDGSKVAGIRFHEQAGVTRDGVSVPEGSTEIFGREIHFSQSGPVKSSDPDDDSNFTVNNIRTDDDDNFLTVGDTVKISADITNNSSTVEWFPSTLKEDGEQIDSQIYTISAGATRTISYEVTRNVYDCFEYQISSSGTVTVCWNPADLQPY